MSLLLARVPKLASVTFAGVGQLTLTPSKVVSASVTFAGAGALALTAARLRAGAVTFAGTGALALTSSTIRGGQATFAGASALVLTPTRLAGAPVAAPFPLGGLPIGRVRKRPAPQPVVPYHVPVDSASYEGLVRALWHVVAEVTPTARPYAPVARPTPLPRRPLQVLQVLVRRLPKASPLVLPVPEAAEEPVELRAMTAPPMAPPRRRAPPVVPEPEVEPAPTPPPAYTPPPPPPTVLPEERAPAVPFQPDADEAARIAAAIEEVTGAAAAAILPAVRRALPWDEEEADTVALMVSLLLED